MTIALEPFLPFLTNLVYINIGLKFYFIKLLDKYLESKSYGRGDGCQPTYRVGLG